MRMALFALIGTLLFVVGYAYCYFGHNPKATDMNDGKITIKINFKDDNHVYSIAVDSIVVFK